MLVRLSQYVVRKVLSFSIRDPSRISFLLLLAGADNLKNFWIFEVVTLSVKCEYFAFCQREAFSSTFVNGLQIKESPFY